MLNHCDTPETNITWHVNYTWMKKKIMLKPFFQKQKSSAGDREKLMKKANQPWRMLQDCYTQAVMRLSGSTPNLDSEAKEMSFEYKRELPLADSGRKSKTMYKQVGQSRMSLGKNSPCDLANMLWVNWEEQRGHRNWVISGCRQWGGHGNLTLSWSVTIPFAF